MKLYKVAFLLSEEQRNTLGHDALTRIHDFVDEKFGDTALVSMVTLEKDKEFTLHDQLTILDR